MFKMENIGQITHPIIEFENMYVYMNEIKKEVHILLDEFGFIPY